jgi:hypothetical protein
MDDGLMLGIAEGFLLGVTEGILLGRDEGFLLGVDDGLVLGIAVAGQVGELVGAVTENVPTDAAVQ